MFFFLIADIIDAIFERCLFAVIIILPRLLDTSFSGRSSRFSFRRDAAMPPLFAYAASFDGYAAQFHTILIFSAGFAAFIFFISSVFC